MTTSTTIGEKVQAIAAFVDKNPAAARAVFKARTVYDSGTQCSAFVRDFPALLVDEPPDLGGKDAGMNPVELLLVALGTCQEIAYALYSSLMGVELDSVTVDLKGHLDLRGVFSGLDDSVPPGFQKITFETRLESEADPEAIQKLIRTVEACCPTLDTIRRPVEVLGNVFLNGEQIATT